MNKFQQSLLQGAANMQKRTMEMRSPERGRQFDRDWASPLSSNLQQSNLDAARSMNRNPLTFNEDTNIILS